MTNSQTGKLSLHRIYKGLVTPAGLTIILMIVAVVLATLDKGFYILINTLVTGGMWALMATGLALGFSVMNVPNFAYGEFFMIGTLVAFYVQTVLGNYLDQNPNVLLAVLSPIVSVFAAMIVGGLAGALVERSVFYNLRKRTQEQWLMNCFLLTLGLSLIMVNGHQLIFGLTLKGIVNYWNVPVISFLGVYVSVERIFVFGLAVIAIGGFWLFLKFTKTGRAMRAVSMDQAGARMVGIKFNAIQTLTMALSCGLAAIAGASLLFMFPSYPTVGLTPLYNSWFVIIMVGMGNIAGTIVGGFVVASLQVITRVYVGEGWEFVFPSALMIIILVFIPSGIFGAKVRGIWDQ